jgi:amino acid adenylation domain-containing protein
VDDRHRGPAPASAWREYPLSGLQINLWLSQLAAPESPLYNVNQTFRIRSPLDVGAMRDAWQAVVDRHEALRTTFGEREGVPVQRTHERLDGHFTLIEAPAAGDRELSERLAALHLHPFDLEREPGAQLVLARRAHDDVVLVLRVHHLVIDLPSCDLIQSELLREYAARRDGVAAGLAAPAHSYEDFVRAERGRADDEAALAGLAFWERELADAPAEPSLPTDRPRAERVKRVTGETTLPIADAATLAALRAFCQAERVSTFRALLAVYFVLLARLGGRHDLIVGTPTNCRPPGFEGVVGNFANLLALRGAVDDAMSFREVLRRLDETLGKALRHRSVPFTEIMRRLAPGRRHDSPLVQTAFALHRLHHLPQLMGTMIRDPSARWEAEIEGLKIGPSPLTTAQYSQFELSFFVVEAGGELRGGVAYDAALFDPSTVARLGECYRTLLASTVAAPTAAVGDLLMLGEGDRRRLVELNDRRAHEFSREGGVGDLVAEQVRAGPGRLALRWPGGELTYRELDGRAERLAGALRAEGVGPEVICGLCVERPDDFVVGALAIWKAGGAYLPMDPAHPDDWLRFMARDAGAAAVVAPRSLAPRFEGVGVRTLPPDGGEAGGAGAAASPTRAVIRGQNLAYVVYTSGSTGQPKGVAVTHRGLANFVAWYRRWCELGSADRVTLVASPSFDAAALEMWPALAAGASLHAPDPSVRADPRQLLRWMAAEEISVTFLTTALTEALLREPWPTGAALRVLQTGGEPLRRRPGRDVSAKFINLYGPTECTVISTGIEITPENDDVLPIGHPIDNLRAYVLNDRLQLAAPGAVGELYLGGEGVARGYLNRPGLTAERFVPDPFSPEGGARLYRTGDLVRRGPSGALEFIGRRDGQVKLRGFRLELGQVEAALGGHPAVHAALAVVREDAPGDRRLVAYVVPARGAHPDPSALREHVGRRLPNFMVPSAVVVLDALPLTANGKVDRKALPPPHEGAPASADAGPRTSAEAAVAKAWARVLQRPSVGVDDDFFDLGGNSMLALEAAHLAGQALGVEVPVSLLLSTPTIAGLCARLAHRNVGGPLLTLRPAAGAPRGTLYCLHPTGGDVAVYRHLVERVAADWEVVGVRDPGAAQGEGESLDGLAARHAAVLAAARRVDLPFALLGWSFGGILAAAVATELEARGTPPAALVLIDPAEPSPYEPSGSPFQRVAPDLGPLAAPLADLAPAERERIGTELLERPPAERAAAARAIALAMGVPVDNAGAAEASAAADAHMAMLRLHRPRPVATPIDAWWAAESIAAGADVEGWRRLTSHLRANVLDAHHYSILRPPAVDALADGLARALRDLAAIPSAAGTAS